jgi:hypothetical protein
MMKRLAAGTVLALSSAECQSGNVETGRDRVKINEIHA